MAKGNRSENRGHRQKIQIDFKELEKLCRMQCSELEIAEWFGCSIDTIAARIKEKFGVSFPEYFSKKRVGGLISLRHNMFKLSEKHPNMAIFLAKNWLNMADKTEIANPAGESFRFEHDAKSRLLDELTRHASRTAAGEDNQEAL
jgi:hypothetical protein